MAKTKTVKQTATLTWSDNTILIFTATADHLVADGGIKTVHNNTPGATAFIVDKGRVGNDTIINFAKNDSLLNNHPIFDGNHDGLIDFSGGNGLLDVDRVSQKNGGDDHLNLTGMDQKLLRFIGDKQGQSVYAYASTKLPGFEEGSVGSDNIDAAGGGRKYLYDTALGLNLGGDTISHFEANDYIVTTSKIYNGIADGKTLSFGLNKLLDLPGQAGGALSDAAGGPGGQIHFTTGVDGHDVDHINYMGHVDTGGVRYYYYGADGSAAIAGATFG